MQAESPSWLSSHLKRRGEPVEGQSSCRKKLSAQRRLPRQADPSSYAQNQAATNSDNSLLKNQRPIVLGRQPQILLNSGATSGELKLCVTEHAHCTSVSQRIRATDH